MSAAVVSLTERLPPEAPIRKEQTLYAAAATHLMVRIALEQHAPTSSELIDELVHTQDPNRRKFLADIIARSAP